LDKRLDEYGGVSGLTLYFDKTPTSSNIKYYISIIRDCYIRRVLIGRCNQIVDDSYNTNDTNVLLEDTEDVLYNIVADAKMGNSELIDDSPNTIAQETIAELVDCWNGNGSSYVKTGIMEFDNSFGGLENGKLIVLSAMGGAGKSTFLQQSTLNMVMSGGSVAYCCLDTDKKEVVKRIVCNMAEVTWEQMHSKDKLIYGNKKDDIIQRLEMFRNMPVHIIGQVDIGQSIDAFCSWALKIKKEKNVKAIFVDSASKFLDTRTNKQSQEEMITNIIGKLTSVSIKTGVPVVAIVELNKGEGSVQQKLKGSNSWHYQARMHIHLDKEKDGEVKLSVVKNNNGRLGDIVVPTQETHYKMGVQKNNH
jgi:replicative DNA helicase